MRGLRAAIVALAVLVALLPRAARALPPGPDAQVSCAAFETRLAQVESQMALCEGSRRTIETQAVRCGEDLETEREARDKAEGATSSCESERNALCRSADTFVRDFLRGHVTNVGTCVLSEEQKEMMALLHSWESASAALARIDAFVSGETDVVPTVSGETVPERLVARLAGTRGEPLFYRRLITEALRIVAPKSWARIREPAASLEAWFSRTEPLSPDIVDEAQRDHPVAGAGQSLSVAARLVQSYLYLGRCSDLPQSRACARARQLAQLLESNGPLLLRRRIESVWSTECDDVGSGAVLSWIQDFPSTQLSTAAADFRDVEAAAEDKLWSCYLADSKADPSFAVYREARLPKPATLNDHTLARVDSLRQPMGEGSPEDVCGRAVRALQTWPEAQSCSLPVEGARAPIERWAKAAAPPHDTDLPLEVCDRYARLLWEGRSAKILTSLPHAPSEGELVSLDPGLLESPIAHTRRVCDERRGAGEAFEAAVGGLSHLSRGLGEETRDRPWRVDEDGRPFESKHLAEARTTKRWLAHYFDGVSSCQALFMADARCTACAAVTPGTYFDCDALRTLDSAWTRLRRMTTTIAVLFVLFIVALRWSVRLWHARRVFSVWSRETRERLSLLGLPAVIDPLRVLFPERYAALTVTLPHAPAWERWGGRAAVSAALGPHAVREADVHQAAQVAARVGARVVFLLHEDPASLAFGAARAILDYAARGGARTMHVLPLAASRLSWARTSEDLLDLVEDASTRGNPFEVRGRITASSQFWNRERLVSGLLAEARAGQWIVLTGLRRLGKSSLALEVSRRLTAPSAYVDLAAFHHEAVEAREPADAASLILRHACERLAASATAHYETLTPPAIPEGALDAAALSSFLRALSVACAPFGGGRPAPLLIILDELESLLGAPRDRLPTVLSVLSIVLGRLRNAGAEAPTEAASSPIAVFIGSALHPLLWAPLQAMGGQSIMGAFASVCVPCLPFEAAGAMMRGLGARQGIRFSEEALDLIIAESQGVPILLRRLGTSILELYDADRARQGALGAVQIGIEAAREAAAREEKSGAPFRVWVESEIADEAGVAGALLRRLAREGEVSTRALEAMAEEKIAQALTASGVMAEQGAEEAKRRAKEAGSVMVKLLGESGLLFPHGDLTDPEGFELPEGAIRRILKG
jgi:hypothetical protein